MIGRNSVTLTKSWSGTRGVLLHLDMNDGLCDVYDLDLSTGKLQRFPGDLESMVMNRYRGRQGVLCCADVASDVAAYMRSVSDGQAEVQCG